MKTRILKPMLCAFLLVVLAVVCTAQRTNMNDGVTFWQDNIIINSTLTAPTANITTANVATANITTADITTANTTTANIATAATTITTVATSFTNNGIYIMPLTAVSITSPTVTTTAAGAVGISVTADQAMTGLIINGGTTGQVLLVRGTSDSNTVRLDDGTSYTLTGNAQLGLGDSIWLRCFDGGVAISAWEEISRSLN